MANFAKIRRFRDLPQNAFGLTYNAKPKIHGSFAKVELHGDGTFTAYSKNCKLDKTNDQTGFYAWCEKYALDMQLSKQLTVFGEFVKPGAHKGCAINKLDKPTLFVFKLCYDGTTVNQPDLIKAVVKEHDCLYVLPYVFKPNIVLSEHMEQQLLNYVELHYGTNCEYASKMFGLVGPGEGLVFSPIISTLNDDNSYLFKVKTKAMSDCPTKAYAPKQRLCTDDEALAYSVATVPRFEAIVSKHPLLVVGERSHTGKFVELVLQDVAEEFGHEFANFKLASKQIAKLAAHWWIANCQ